MFRTHHQGTPGLLQTLTVLVAEKLNMKKPPTTSIVRRASVTMPMDTETFKELFGGLPSAPNLLGATKFSVPIHELDAIMPAGWSLNTFKTSVHDLSVAARQACRDCSFRVQKSVFCSFGLFALSRWEWSPHRLKRHGAESSVWLNSFKGLILP